MWEGSVFDLVIIFQKHYSPLVVAVGDGSIAGLAPCPLHELFCTPSMRQTLRHSSSKQDMWRGQGVFRFCAASACIGLKWGVVDYAKPTHVLLPSDERKREPPSHAVNLRRRGIEPGRCCTLGWKEKHRYLVRNARFVRFVYTYAVFFNRPCRRCILHRPDDPMSFCRDLLDKNIGERDGKTVAYDPACPPRLLKVIACASQFCFARFTPSANPRTLGVLPP